MKEELPAPDFNAKNYARPNQKWVCGWLRDGHSCPHGPDGDGQCGALPECHPVLQKRAGERELYICARSKEHGGPCEAGPNPDGRCCHPPKRCQPQLSLRARRGLFTKTVIAATLGILLVIFYGSARWQFILPGELSLKHTTATFRQKARDLHGAGKECAACHTAGQSGPLGWTQAALAADPPPHDFKKLLAHGEPQMTPLDTACLQCHPQRDFHQPNVAWNYSCSSCHQEHRGSGVMLAPDDRHCVRCHGDEKVMRAAAEKGRARKIEDFDFQFDWSRNSFKAPRPANGYTKVITEFSKDHPEFQIHVGQFKDYNTLRFSHATHRADNPKMTLLHGKSLDCTYCHQPGPGGQYYKLPTLENNCKVCHEFQFDPATPGLTIPHGDPAFAQAFLRSLPQQFANHATREKGIVAQREMDGYVREKMSALRQLYGSGEELERKVFFGDENAAPVTGVGRLGLQGRSLFPGCAYCHEVKAAPGVPVVTPPVTVERWLDRGFFDHTKHTHVGCTTCHPANASRKPTDILVASKHMCATCHRPQGAARNDCFECHSYHHGKGLPQLGGRHPFRAERE